MSGDNDGHLAQFDVVGGGVAAAVLCVVYWRVLLDSSLSSY